jgi:hypothetical protein
LNDGIFGEFIIIIITTDTTALWRITIRNYMEYSLGRKEKQLSHVGQTTNLALKLGPSEYEGEVAPTVLWHVAPNFYRISSEFLHAELC